MVEHDTKSDRRARNAFCRRICPYQNDTWHEPTQLDENILLNRWHDLTAGTSLPATPPYRPPFWCSYCVRLPPQQRHLEDVGFKTLHIDSLYIWLLFYVIDQRPI